eukprot:4209338-Prymnesium_polylepis.1
MKIRDAQMVQRGSVRHTMRRNCSCSEHARILPQTALLTARRPQHPHLLSPPRSLLARPQGLVLSGVDRTDWKFKFFSGNFKDIIDELVEPKDPADVDRALALLE